MALPDLEAWAVFAKVVQAGSFSGAAAELGRSKATVSKALGRLEAQIGAPLLQRTSRRLALTDIGRQALVRAERMLGEAEAAENEATSQAATPRGRVRVTAPMQFGIDHVAPLLPKLFAAYPDIVLDVHFTDRVVDLVGEGFDIAVRIAALADSSLKARRLCAVRTVLVGAPAYLAAHGTPGHPQDLLRHRCLTYAYLGDPNRWRFVPTAGGSEVIVTPRGPLHSNSGEAFLPLLRAAHGLAVLPEFAVWRDVEAGTLRPILCQWRLPPLALSLVMPPGSARPARVTAVVDLLARHLSAAPWARLLEPPQFVAAP